MADSGGARALNVAIIGSGAVGLGLGSCLLEAGAKLRFVVRSPAPASALRSQGLERTGIFGECRFSPAQFQVSESLDELTDRNWDAILVCTKTTATTAVARRLGTLWGHLPGDVALLVCHNGWGSAEAFAAHIPARSVFSARVITGFIRHQAHSVEVSVHAQPIRIGSVFGASPSRLDGLCDAITRGGIPCETSPDIVRDLWAKMLYNCALNPLGAILRVPYGALADNSHTRALLDSVIDELFRVMQAAGFETHWASPNEYRKDFYERLLPPTASHLSSMLQDLRDGKPTEIDALSGAAVRLAAEHGVAAPVNAAFADLIRAIEQRRPAAST